MIFTSVVPCLFSGLAKNNKIMSMFVLFSRPFCNFESLEICGFWGCFLETKVTTLMYGWYKGDYTDVWMVKITIKTNQIDMEVCFFQS